MVKAQSFLLLLFVFAIGSSVQAWTTMALTAIGRLSTRASLSTWTTSSTALNYKNGVEYEKGTASSSTTITTTNINEHDTKISLQTALQAAQDADRFHGLCSPKSNRAWAVVDDIYLSSSASSEVESHVRRVLGHEKSIWDL